MKKKKERLTSEIVADFLSTCKEIKSEYQHAYEEVNIRDKQTQDVLHQIELGSAADRSKFMTQLARIRQERRVYKDFVDIHSKFVALLDDKQTAGTMRMLEQQLGELRKQENAIHTRRAYRPRSLKNLTIRTIETKGEN